MINLYIYCPSGLEGIVKQQVLEVSKVAWSSGSKVGDRFCEFCAVETISPVYGDSERNAVLALEWHGFWTGLPYQYHPVVHTLQSNIV